MQGACLARRGRHSPALPGILTPVTQGWGLKGGLCSWEPWNGEPKDLSSRVASPVLCMTPKSSPTLCGSQFPPLCKENTLFPALSPLVAGVGSPASQGLPEVGRFLTLQHRFLVLPRDGSDHRTRHLTLVTAAALADKELGQALRGRGLHLQPHLPHSQGTLGGWA